MLRQLLNKFGATIYAQIWENRIKLTDSITGNTFDEKPLVAFERNNKGEKIIVAVGDSALMSFGENVEVINPFSHPRVLFSNFIVGEKLFQYALKKIFSKKLLVLAPVMVIHPMEKTEGGLTMIEIRAFRELAFRSGAKDSVIYEGQELPIQGMDFESIKKQVGEQ